MRQNRFARLADLIVPPILTVPALFELLSVENVRVHDARGRVSVEPAFIPGTTGIGHTRQALRIATPDGEVLDLLTVLLTSVDPAQQEVLTWWHSS